MRGNWIMNLCHNPVLEKVFFEQVTTLMSNIENVINVMKVFLDYWTNKVIFQSL